MHENQGADSVIEDGKKRFIDIDLPGTPGTIMNAEFANAVMEEMRNILIYAGMTFEGTAAADRAAGWVQLKTAIFESAAIDSAALANYAITKIKLASNSVDNDKIENVDLAKAYGELTLLYYGSVDYQRELTLNDEELVFETYFNGQQRQVTMDGYGLWARNYGTLDTRDTLYRAEGITNNNIANSPAMRMSTFELAISGWDVTGTIFTGELLGLPKGTKIMDAYFTAEDTGNNGDLTPNGLSTYDGPFTRINAGNDTTAYPLMSDSTFSYTKEEPNMYVRVSVTKSVLSPVYSSRKLYVMHG